MIAVEQAIIDLMSDDDGDYASASLFSVQVMRWSLENHTQIICLIIGAVLGALVWLCVKSLRQRFKK